MNTSSLPVRVCLVLFLIFFMAGCGPTQVSYPPSKKAPATQRPYKINGKTYYPVSSSRGYREYGMASWYGKKFHGRKTANGETYNMYGMTAAHKTLPMNTMLLVRNLENGQETVVRVNDRGPFSRGRILDLSYAAANDINMVRKGVARVEIIALAESYGSGKDKFKYQDFNSGIFYIQVGAFLNRSNAVNLARLLDKTGLRITIQPYYTNDGTYHRVQVYAGTSLYLARQLEERIINSGYADSFVIAR